MTSEYPDILGDLVEARDRAEVNGLHYVASLHPSTIAPGETTHLRLWLQSCWDVPVEVAIVITLPAQPEPTFSIIQKRTDVPLEPAEVGEVAIPIACTADTRPADYILWVKIGAKPKERGLFVRSKENQGHLEGSALSFTTGMGLAASMGLGFKARTQSEKSHPLHVSGLPQPGPPPNLMPTYLSHWTVDQLPIQGKARKLVNDQRLYILPQLARQALFVAFLEESQARFEDAQLSLQMGEAIFLSKILTYTIEYFLKLPDGQDGILVPAYSLAYRYDLPTNDPVFLVVRADYARIARLACSLSFGLLRQRQRRDIWSLEEQMAVADFLADRVERGGNLPAEFLYLPLLLGGLMVADRVKLGSENLAQSLDLLAKARQQRADELAQNPDLVALLDQIWQAARSSA
jgi:hypothetical protein